MKKEIMTAPTGPTKEEKRKKKRSRKKKSGTATFLRPGGS